MQHFAGFYIIEHRHSHINWSVQSDLQTQSFLLLLCEERECLICPASDTTQFCVNARSSNMSVVQIDVIKWVIP